MMCPVTTPLGEWLRELREKKGLNQAELAESVRVDRKMIQRWEGGENEPGATNLLLLFDALGVHFSPLLDVGPRALNAELAEHNKLLQRLERKIDRMQRTYTPVSPRKVEPERKSA